MSNPSPFAPGYDFSDYQASAPTAPLPGDELDNQFAQVAAATEEIVNAILDVRRSDGALKNGIVTADAIANDVLVGLQTPTTWASATAYVALNTVVYQSGTSVALYRCVESHTSGAFATDLADGKWEQIFDIDALIGAPSWSELTDVPAIVESFSAITLTDGDLLYGASGAATALALGTSGHFLKAGASAPAWAAITWSDVGSVPANVADIAAITQTAGDLIYSDGTDLVDLAIGTSGQFLKSTGTAPSWATLAWSDVGSKPAAVADLAGLTLASGDVLYVDGSGDLVNLAKGSNGQVLGLTSGFPAWQNAAGGGDMAAATYDPTSIAGDAFARANHTGTQASSTITAAATSRILGRATAGAGAVEELTAAQVSTLMGGYRQLAAAQYLTSGTNATFTPSSNCRALFVECIGGGGGGGGVDGQGASTGGCSGGGGGGGYSSVFITDMDQTFTYTIGAGGAGGTGSSNGSNGSNTSFWADAVLVAKGGGGVGGSGTLASASAWYGFGGAGGVGTDGDLNLSGRQGGMSRGAGLTFYAMGTSGAAPIIGGGGKAPVDNSVQNAPASDTYGEGGASPLVYNTTTNYAGGDGYQGVIRVTEFY
jgi:hypothetical protein